VAFYDIFNGDADGICALQQLRLAQPRDSRLITGVKRDVGLLARVQAGPDDELTVLDISLDENRAALEMVLATGAHCAYFDHHFPGPIPNHPNLVAHIRYAPDVCTSLLVDQYLAGRFRAWAVVAAFGDNLPGPARAAALHLDLDGTHVERLRVLGECINYNAYGDQLEDLRFHPAALYRRLSPFADPLEFADKDPAFEILRHGYERDMQTALAVAPLLDTPTHRVVVLPDADWSRRVHGVLANRLASANPSAAHAVLVGHGNAYRVSVRAPISRPSGADELCRAFPTGGGRPGAAGINRLPGERLQEFVSAFQDAFGPQR